MQSAGVRLLNSQVRVGVRNGAMVRTEKKIRVHYPQLVVIYDLIVVCRSPQPGPWATGQKYTEVHDDCAHPTCSLKFPYIISQRVADYVWHDYRAWPGD